MATKKKEFIKAVHLRLGLNIGDLPYYRNTIRFDERLWRHSMDYAAKVGINMILLDIQEGVRYSSHPELAAIDARSAEWMNAEVRKYRAKGVEIVPKFNFSLGHDGWFGDYTFMIGTKTYWRAVMDIMQESYEIFEKPRFFHIGMDEEADNDRNDVVQVRIGDFYWQELGRYAKASERCGMCPWMWSDKGWNERKEFLEKCPKSIVQSNWHYDDWAVGFDVERLKKSPDWIDRFQCDRITFMNQMDEAGFSQIPCGSVYMWDRRFRRGFDYNDSMIDLIKYCRKTFDSERLLGFLMSGWNEYNDPATERINDHSADLVIEGCAAAI